MANIDRHDEIQGRIVHVYDGIEEADNRLPLWWLITFYGAIVFGALYWFYYHEYGNGTSSMQAYIQAVDARRAASGEMTGSQLTALASDAAAVTSGQAIFQGQCVACHNEQGQGREGLGPNLTDRYWIHGGAPMDLHTVITEGVGAKGMPAWEPILGSKGVAQVTAYVLTLRNSEVKGKAPEGELWEP